MKRRPPVLKLSQGILGFLQYKTAAGLRARFGIRTLIGFGCKSGIVRPI